MPDLTDDEITARAIEQALREVPEPTRGQAHDAVRAAIEGWATSYWDRIGDRGVDDPEVLIDIRRLEYAARLLRGVDWQPIEALPTEPGPYTVALSTGDVVPGWYDPDGAATLEDGMVLSGPWLIVDGKPDNQELAPFVPPEFLNCVVTYWKPLPEPPQ